ncbi:MAG: hypothetical protein Q9159_002637 [Coniocarpon cinnabarinum]
MVFLSASPDLSVEALNLFHTTEPSLANAPILVFKGPAPSTAASVVSSSRIQIHVFTAAGFQSYSRIAISPNSPLYNAVNRLSREDQGDEVCRELAYGIFKYFSELSQDVKDAWKTLQICAREPGATTYLFTEQHAADLASRMQPVEDVKPVIEDVKIALASKSISYQDADIILPSGAIQQSNDRGALCAHDNDPASYGKYAELIRLLGEQAFVPTSKIRRAPSRPTARNNNLKYTTAQKEALRREMCELVDTEESYVEKLDDFVRGLVADVRGAVGQKPSNSDDSDARTARLLFPTSLDKVLEVNTSFMHAVRNLFDETEAAAIEDIGQAQPNGINKSGNPSQDPIGVVAFARCILEHLSGFQSAYPAYIAAHQNMAQTLRYVMQQDESNLSRHLCGFGEKKLNSLLIEPVQRLPRYSLYIENMTKQLPTQHPALAQLLKAKDAIAEMCASDVSTPNHSQTVTGLKSRIEGWPSTLNPRGRLVTAIDAVELQPPYNPNDQSQDLTCLVILLFSDVLVYLQKPSASTITGRSLLVGLENPTQRADSNPFDDQDWPLEFERSFALHELRVTEMQDGQVIQVASRWPTGQAHSAPSGKTFRAIYLLGPYENRASKFTKEFVKARIEGRFSEQERETPKWQARDLEGSDKRLGLFTAIFEERQNPQAMSSATSAVTKIVLDPEKHRSRYAPSIEGADTIASLTVAGNGFFRIEIDSILSDRTKDFVTGSEFVAVLTKRLTSLAQMRGSMRNPALTRYLLQHYDAILRAIQLPSERLSRSRSRTKTLRQHSPVKAIANLFGGSSKQSHEQPSHHAPSKSASSISSRPHLGPKSRSESKMDLKLEPFTTTSSTTATIVTNETGTSNIDMMANLDAGLETCVLALRARKGNIIGRVITNRSGANETTVDQIYKSLLERPEDHEPTSQAPVDALFAAFERFLKEAWAEKLGPVLDGSVLKELQAKSEMLPPVDFEDFLTTKIDDMIPQNRRALRGIIGLLIDLLDGTGNDGDRGALMATITEMMVCEGNPHDYMPLFDRLVEEHDVILSETYHSTTPKYGSTATRSAHTGSFSSKASSLGRRLGFGTLSRKNSRPDALNAALTAQNDPRALLGRTKSFDWNKVSSPLSRPGSRDRPPTGSSESRPGTGKLIDQEEPINNFKIGIKEANPRKKRRSSLSDIEGLPSVNTSPFWNSPSPRRPEASPLTNKAGLRLGHQQTPSMLSRPRPRLNISNSPPVIPPQTSQSPFLGRAAQSGSATVSPSASPARANAVKHRMTTPKKENETPRLAANRTPSPSPANTLNRAQSSPVRNPRQSSNLPPPRAPLSERPGSGNTPPPLFSNSGTRPASSKESSPSKLRTPSPSPSKSLNPRPRASTTQIGRDSLPKAGLNDRLAENQSAIANAEADLMAELEKIGQELKTAPSTPSRMASRRETSLNRHGSRLGPAGLNARNDQLEARLKALELNVPKMFQGLTEQTKALEAEVKEELAGKDRRIEELEVALGIR